MQMTTDAIRQAFLNYFAQNGHQIVDSSSLVPHNDPTLLFTNAGMNQFKDLFLGSEKRDYSRAVTAQRCVRAGGKHNDLDNVGFTARHHTFFEMLGNFSFGDYFKKEAIHFAWQFLTEVLKLPKDKLTVTVYYNDDEAYHLWADDIGIPKERIIRIGDKGEPYNSDNFWQMGDTGPCGPCSEIFFDHGESIWGGPPGSAEEDGDRFIEIWNLVFMQFNRQADGTLLHLPKPSVDTGMGLERLAAVLQQVHSNYEIDLFATLIQEVATLLNVTDLEDKSLRVISDHIRSCSYLISDGAIPSNEGRGYVLRRIIRRAVRHGHKLGATEPFFYKLVKTLVTVMGSANATIKEQESHIETLLLQEEQNFARTLDRGMELLNQAIVNCSSSELDGETVFKLYDTYGFPMDLTFDVARDHNLTIDEAGFEKAMQTQKERARNSGQFTVDYNQALVVNTETEFCGYEMLILQAKITEIYRNGESVDKLEQGEEGIIFLNKTTFYAESGGQSGDIGLLSNQSANFKVIDTQKYNKAVGHIGMVQHGTISCGDILDCEVDRSYRQGLKQHHSATHLLHAALRQILGTHVQQKGSLVKTNNLRFDFSHNQPITAEDITKIEQLVNKHIHYNHPVVTEVMAIDEAKDRGAMALFGEKYDSNVRVLTIDDFSVELCGGTHVEATGEIGLLKISSESSIASGIRRIEALTGAYALTYYSEQQQKMQLELDSTLQRLKQTEKQLTQLKEQIAAKESSNLADHVESIKNTNVLIYKLVDVDNKSLRTMVDELKNQLKSAVILLANVSNNDKVQLIVGVTDDLTSKIQAGTLVNFVALQVGGKGGGRADMAQAGGQDITSLSEALSSARVWISEHL